MTFPHNLLDLDSIENSEIEKILAKASSILTGELDVSNTMMGHTLCPIFLQESSRTYMNSTSSFLRMNGTVLPVQLTSTRFGSDWTEPIQDFCTLLNACADIVITRSPDTDTVHQIAKHTTNPVINAGNGSGERTEHPIQALIDLFTIRLNFGITSLRIVMIGHRHIRTARTQIKLFHHFGHKLIVMSPPTPVANRDLDSFCSKNCDEINTLDSVDLGTEDIIYHNGTDEDPAAFYAEKFVFSQDILKQRGFSGNVMHSLPRKNELRSCIASTPFNLYFSQMINARPVFQAIFHTMRNELRHA